MLRDEAVVESEAEPRQTGRRRDCEGEPARVLASWGNRSHSVEVGLFARQRDSVGGAVCRDDARTVAGRIVVPIAAQITIRSETATNL